MLSLGKGVENNGQIAVTADDILDEIIRREGGYVNDKADKGGCTRYGVTQKTLSAWRKRAVTCEEVAMLSSMEARAIYREWYVKPFEALRTAPELLGLLVDCGVNHGVSRAITWLQQAAGTIPDGKIGLKTLAAVNGKPWGAIFRDVLKTRLKFYASIVHGDQSQAKFIKGWINRACEFI